MRYFRGNFIIRFFFVGFVFHSASIIKYGYDNNDNLQESNVNTIFLHCCGLLLVGVFFLHSHFALSLHLLFYADNFRSS